LQVSGQSALSAVDLHYLYTNAHVAEFRSQSISKDTTSLVMFQLGITSDSLARLAIRYYLVSSFDNRPSTLLTIADMGKYLQTSGEQSSVYAMGIDNRGKKKLVLILEDTLSLNSWQLPVNLAYGSTGESPNIFLGKITKNVPILAGSVPVASRVRINALFSVGHQYDIDYYDHHFLPAKPPMANNDKPANVPLTIDSTFTVFQLDTFQFEKNGLYFIHEKDSKVGLCIRAEASYYPKPGKIEDLVESLIYIASKEEYKKLTTSFKKKQLFDEFWLNNAKSEEKARRVIKEYYKRVAEANRLFTDYKEGWKTDKGMIYIIYGHPNRVFINDNEEMWIYNKTFQLPRTSFVFKRVNTAFSNHYYVLDRRPELQLAWFRAVDLWRKGKKDF